MATKSRRHAGNAAPLPAGFAALTPSKTFRVLESGPVVLVTTRNMEGVCDVMTMGFHMMMQHDPPLVGAIIGPWNVSRRALDRTGECVIAVPPMDLAEKVIDIGNCSVTERDKFDYFGLSSLEGTQQRAPLIRECWANLECRVADARLAKQYDLFVLEVLQVWIDTERKNTKLLHHQGDGRLIVDGELIDLGSRMTKWQSLG